MNKEIKDTQIAIISEDVGHLTGGRYYVYFLASALVEVGYDVTVYTNNRSVFGDYFDGYKRPKIELYGGVATDLRNINIKADIYIGSPINGCIAATRLGEKYNKPSYAVIFDPIPMIEHYRKIKVPSASWKVLAEALRTSDTKIISLCKEPSLWIYDWLDKAPEQVFEVYPCINSIAKEKAKRPERSKEDYVVFISRLVSHKRLDHTLYACQKANINLKVISSIDGIGARRMVRQHRMSGRVQFLMKLDDIQKFEVIYGARALINSSVFEGFGIPTVEALSCGIPVVAYDYPTTKEIAEYCGTDMVYFARYKDHKDLAFQLKKALAEDKRNEGIHDFDFAALVKRMSEVIQ